MGEVSLFEHNEIAYKKLCALLESSNYATINHATGTGKSFIALKYLYEHRDKKFLYLTPTYPIINQLLSDCSKIGINPEELNFDQMIYRAILVKDPRELFDEYDGFILDEYHRAGAKQTYRKIKELKHLIDSSEGSQKKFIGLTATPTRYLDRERNMTDELFDGNVASTITLAQAMADGLLPIPTYVNTKISCLSQYEIVEKRLKRLAPSEKKKSLKARMESLKPKLQVEGSSIKETLDRYEKSKNGKYIVFCNNIDEANAYFKSCDGWFMGCKPFKKFVVHSGFPHETRQKALDGFNDANKGASALFCVDVLNEGVHARGVNRAIMLRSTLSPIIYFQQIGRVLSYSGKDDDVIIYDLADNFKNHEAIYGVYRDFEEEISRRIEEHPEQKEHYMQMLSKFRILDETKEIIDELDSIEQELTPEKIAESRIDHAIEFLEKYLQSRKSKDMFILDSSCKSKAVRDAYFTLSQYYEFVTNQQFEKLKNFNMLLPAEFMMTTEERMEYLEGANSIHEKERKDAKGAILTIANFIRRNARRPNIDIPEEAKINATYLRFLPYIEDDQKAYLKDALSENEIELEVWEKLLLDEPIDSGDDFDVLIENSKEFLSKGNKLPEYMKAAVENAIYHYNSGRHKELFNIIDESDKLDKQNKEEEYKTRRKKIKDTIDFLEENIELTGDELRESEQIKQLPYMSYGDRAYIISRFRKMRKGMLKKTMRTGREAPKSFYRDLRTMEDDEIVEWFNKTAEDVMAYKKISDIMESDYVYSEEELEKFFQQGIISEDVLKYYLETSILGINSRNMMAEISEEEIQKGRNNLIILKAIGFLRVKKRQPLKSSRNQEESELAKELEYALNRIPKKDANLVRRLFTLSKVLDRTCEQYARNIREREMEGAER